MEISSKQVQSQEFTVNQTQAQDMTREIVSKRTRSLIVLTSRALREGLPIVLTYREDEVDEPEPDSETDEEDEPALEDGDKETLNDDEPSEPLDYEWSPWCDDTESISLREYLEQQLDWERLNNDELRCVKEILAKNEEQVRIDIQSLTDEQLRSNLERLVGIYDFNYHLVGFADFGTPLPEVRLSREEKAGGEYKFTVAVMVNCNEEVVEKTPENENLKNSWIALLGGITWLLVESKELKQPFFGADSFDDGWDNVKNCLVQRSWSQTKLYEEWANSIVIKQDDEDENQDEERLERNKKYLRDRVSEIKNHRYLELEFFDVTIPFAQFFPTKADIR